MESFDGKIAVATGGNSGIGYAAAKLLREKRGASHYYGKKKRSD